MQLNNVSRGSFTIRSQKWSVFGDYCYSKKHGTSQISGTFPHPRRVKLKRISAPGANCGITGYRDWPRRGYKKKLSSRMRNEGFSFYILGVWGWTRVRVTLLLVSATVCNRLRATCGTKVAVSMGKATITCLSQRVRRCAHVVLRGRRGTSQSTVRSTL